jgi:hypothetical protein
MTATHKFPMPTVSFDLTSSGMRWLLESSGNEVVDALVNRAVCDGCKLVQERRSA